jgi:serine phosphatase RsbU (regulator of sigma subunit)/Flp pilus assembly protein TadD
MNKFFLIILILIQFKSFSTDIVFSQTKIDSLENILQTSDEKDKIFFELYKQYNGIDKFKQEHYLLKSIENFNSKTKTLFKNNIFHLLGQFYYDFGNYDEAIAFYKKAINTAKILNIDTTLAAEYNNIGMVYTEKTEFEIALEYYNKALILNKKHKHSVGMSDNLSNIGMLYRTWGKLDDAIEHINKALEIDLKYNNKNNIAIDYNNLGLCYQQKQNNKKAIYYYQTAVSIDSSNNNYTSIANYINNIGLIYYSEEKFQEAINSFELAIKISKSQNQVKNSALFLQNLAALFSFKLKNNVKAFEKLEESKKICIENNFTDLLSSIYYIYYKIYLAQNDYKNALNYYELRSQTQDSIFNKESQESLDHYKTKYETEKKERELEVLKKDEIVKNLKIKKQNITIYSISAGLIIFIIFLIIIYKAYKQKYLAFETIKIQKDEIQEKNAELNQQNEEILAQRDEIESQKNILSYQNKQITDSIIYAENIQKALLPPKELMDTILPNHFVINLPKNIVSGDFYWSKTVNGKIIIAVSDCTGHGVPGAFMSMLGTAFLNEIISTNEILETGKILAKLKNLVISSLHQTGNDYTLKDGMDIALCIIDYNTNTIQYSGAYNPLIIVDNKQLTEIKATKMPIGIYNYGKNEFETHNLKFDKGSCIYLFSDGYHDQFDSITHKKLGKNAFYKKLVDVSGLPTNEQKEKLLDFHFNLKQNSEQIDDILVVGIKL